MPRTFTTAASKTVTISKVKAKHIANQAGLDRLQELLVKATSNPNATQNYAITIKRAFRSLQECKEPILTQKDAVKLKYIGPAMAKKICPQSTGVEVQKTSKPKKAKAAAKSNTTSKAGNNDYENFLNNISGAPAATGLRPSTGLPLVCPRPSIQSTSRCNSTLESFSTAKEEAYAAAKAEAERLVLPPRGPWKVVLLVDGREHKSKQVVSSCKQAGIPCEERHLAIGDMAWIARCVIPNESSTSMPAATSKKRKKAGEDDKFRTIEILVGTIVERKEVNDLAGSLFGTRYAEQRLRLSQCGLPQVLFLVEGNLATVNNCPSETLQMAMMETRINLGFQIVHTKHLTDTVNILKTLHSRIVQRTFPDAFGKSSTGASQQALPRFGGNRRGNRRASSLLELVFDTAPVPPFGSKRFITYPELKAKVEVDRERGTRSVRAISLAMLKQIPTLSQKKCTAIANHYPTLNQLLTALSYPNQSGSAIVRKQHPKKIVQEIEIDSGRRTIGPVSASEIYAACCTLEDGSTVACHEQDTKQAAADIGQTTMSSFLLGGVIDNDENRMSPSNADTNASKPAATSRREIPPMKKVRTKDSSAIATATASKFSQSQLQHLEPSNDSSPEEPPRAFSTRKRPAPTPPKRKKIQSVVDDQNQPRFNIHSPLRKKQSPMQETVDLLTPESSGKPKAKPAAAKKLTMMDLSDCSDSSEDICDTLGNARKNSALISNLNSKNDIAKGVASKKSGTPDKPVALLLSSDEEESPFPTKANLTGAPENRNFTKFDNVHQLNSNIRAPSTKGAANRLSLDSSSGESSFLFSSPDEKKATNRMKTQLAASQRSYSEAKLSGRTNTSEKDSEIGIVCLLDDSDDETNSTAGGGLTGKSFEKPSSDAPDLGKRDAFVTTTRGGALPSTQESVVCDDGNSSSSDEDLEIGTSLRNRLGAIQGRDLREVIELDSDSE